MPLNRKRVNPHYRASHRDDPELITGPFKEEKSVSPATRADNSASARGAQHDQKVQHFRELIWA